jgi:hypothetical protein
LKKRKKEKAKKLLFSHSTGYVMQGPIFTSKEQGCHDWKACAMCSVEESIKMWQKAIPSVQCLAANLLHLKTITQHTIL